MVPAFVPKMFAVKIIENNSKNIRIIEIDSEIEFAVIKNNNKIIKENLGLIINISSN